MSLIDVLVVGLIVAFFIDWSAVIVVTAVERKNPGIRTLTDRKWVSIGIALGSTALVALSAAYYTQTRLDSFIATLLLVVPVYILTFVNAVFLWLTAKGQW
jgi:hypothetical protein